MNNAIKSTALFASIFLASVAGACSVSPANNSLEQRVEKIGFSRNYNQYIDEAKDKVAETYNSPDLLFYMTDDILENAGFEGLVKDRGDVLPENIVNGKFKDHYLIVMAPREKEMKDFLKLSPYALVKYDRPIVSLACHEIGHSFYQLLSDDDKKFLRTVFTEADIEIGNTDALSDPRGKGYVTSGCSFHSLSKTFMDEEFQLNSVEEQFCDIFAYLALKCDYNKGLPLHQKKADAVLKVMKPFAKQYN
jgi:hypothetical protein